jgi:peptidoglycan/xylan/chitin deacetylase (PgdA/CDA1 family)
MTTTQELTGVPEQPGMAASTPQPRWPNGAKAAISFTMDNLGEAQDVNRGLWPADQPIGQHRSVKETLPRMLDMLDKHGIKATYFAESWSLHVYPDAARELLRRGHEVAWHGFQHETWHQLSKEEEELNFEKSFAAAGELGVEYKGFRPPGGKINERTYELCRKHGIEYTSPLGHLGIERGVVVLPFEWKGVDALYYMDKFSGIRESHGLPKETLPPEAFEEFLLSKLDEMKRTGGYTSILFHPFLQTDDDKFQVLDHVLGRLASEKDSIWLAPCCEVSSWVSAHPHWF